MTPAKILVVDDEVELERLIRQRFRKKIKAKEIDFLFAADGREALAQLQADAQVDMVLTDINMPQMDGLALLKHLSDVDQTLRAVVMSAYSDLDNIRKAMNRGAFDFLIKPIDFQDLEMTIQRTLACVQQVRQQQQQAQQAQQALWQVAYHDSLTGLPNRAWFTRCLMQRIEQQQNQTAHYAVLFIDLNHFKVINDRFGHLAGDKLLQCVAQRLRHCLRKPDTVARLGGDEFAILLDAIRDVSEAVEIAHRIQSCLQHPFKLEGIKVYAEASIGIALSHQSYTCPDAILRDADLAMYRAKVEAKGQFKVFEPTMQLLAQTGLPPEVESFSLGADRQTEQPVNPQNQQQIDRYFRSAGKEPS